MMARTGEGSDVHSHSSPTTRATQWRLALAVLVSLAAAGCQSSGDSGVKSAAQAAGFATTVGESKPFVSAQRPGQLEYMPVGVTPPQRDIKPKTAKELAAYERSLEAQRVSSQQKAAKPPPKFKPLQQPRQLPPVPAGRTLQEED